MTYRPDPALPRDLSWPHEKRSRGQRTPRNRTCGVRIFPPLRNESPPTVPLQAAKQSNRTPRAGDRRESGRLRAGSLGEGSRRRDRAIGPSEAGYRVDCSRGRRVSGRMFAAAQVAGGTLHERSRD